MPRPPEAAPAASTPEAPTEGEDGERVAVAASLRLLFPEGRPTQPERVPVEIGAPMEVVRERAPGWINKWATVPEVPLLRFSLVPSRLENYLWLVVVDLPAAHAAAAVDSVFGPPSQEHARSDGASKPAWLNPDAGIKAQLTDSPTPGYVSLHLTRYAPLAELLGGGAHFELGIAGPLLGSTKDDLMRRYRESRHAEPVRELLPDPPAFLSSCKPHVLILTFYGHEHDVFNVGQDVFVELDEHDRVQAYALHLGSEAPDVKAVFARSIEGKLGAGVPTERGGKPARRHALPDGATATVTVGTRGIWVSVLAGGYTKRRCPGPVLHRSG